MPSDIAKSANRVWTHGRIASATPVAISRRGEASRPATAVNTPAMTSTAPRPSGYTVNASNTNGTDNATDAQPNHDAAISPVVRQTATHARPVAAPLTIARKQSTPAYPNNANAGATTIGRPGA